MIKTSLFIPLALFFASCASYRVIPENIVRYDKGVEILNSEKAHSKVQIEVSQKKLGGLNNPPLVIYIGTQITQGANIILDTDDVIAMQNGTKLKVLNYREVLDSNFDFTNILQDFSIPTPTVAVNTNVITPIFYFGRGGFLAYNMLFNPFIINDAQTQQMLQEQRQARKIMGANYLRKTTLSIEGKAKGGFVAISPKHIKAGKITLKIQIGDEAHLFNIDIEKR
ncbi:hypothetical protein [Helicobacter sp. 13S00477-4]|uniref:hypothetical protein n=1 Tax=Helicobacter sp. 13S00477-4 TaxID=1905759 RepID=UPI000BA4EC8F|nr:hypothetical protein [Helicobacter sp. 13S00477-4]PAF51543.1 hypothetical protein BKH44_05740 [Helicobacter sp. 13S00477-4]